VRITSKLEHVKVFSRTLRVRAHFDGLGDEKIKTIHELTRNNTNPRPQFVLVRVI